MKYWDEIIQDWQNMQKQFIDNLPFKLPKLDVTGKQSPPWEMPQLQTFMSWGQSAVSQSMELQSHWLGQWASQMESVIEKSTTSKSDMITRIQESMTGWSENQAELWDYWFKMVEETTSDMDDPSALIEGLESWKETINESMTAQTESLDRWSREIHVEDLSAEELLKASAKMQETMNGWLDLQGELWHQWFDFLKLNEGISAQTAKPVKQAKPAKKPKPVKASKPTAEASSQISKALDQANDNLEVISGIGPALAKKLYAQGIVNLKQIADLTDKEIEKLEETIIKFPGRIRRENWVQQAIDLLNK